MKRIPWYFSLPLLALWACAHPQVVAQPPLAEEPGFTSLFTDQRARQVGDLVTVQIYESSKGSRRVTSKAEKKSDLKADLKIDSVNSRDNKATLKTGNDYEAESGLQRAGSLVANITAQVMGVLPNGNLVVHGEQEIKLEGSVQTIRLDGVVRPQDISPSNTVLSTRLADAKIEYKSSREPWIHRYGLLGWVASLVF